MPTDVCTWEQDQAAYDEDDRLASILSPIERFIHVRLLLLKSMFLLRTRVTPLILTLLAQVLYDHCTFSIHVSNKEWYQMLHTYPLCHHLR
jgi:hypothetical protein